MDWATLLLSAGAGFGAAVWFVIGLRGRRAHPWHTGWYVLLGLAYLVAGFLLGARSFRIIVIVPPWVTTVILAALLIVPPALQLETWLKAQRLVRGR